jgi:hypothetical protein
MHCLILTLEHHHDSEETVLFPALEREIGMMGYLDIASEQHKTFHDGLHALWDVAKACQIEPDQWRWEKVKDLLDSFMPALELHLTEEVDLMLSLDKYEEAGLRRAWEESVKKGQEVGILGLVRQIDAHRSMLTLLTHSVQYTLFPLMLGCHDRTYGHGPRFPPVPKPMYYVVHYGASWVYSGAWRFSPSDFWGNPRPLRFITASS